jgi:MFS family permease
LISHSLLIIANGLFNILLGVRAKLEGFPTGVVGIVLSAYFIGLLLGGLYSVRVIARAGHIRAYAAFASLMSVSALMHVLIVHPVAWWLMRLTAGFCMAGMIMVTESWIQERSSNVNRGQVLSIYMISNFLASGCGQFLLPLADPGEFVLFSIASILFSLALVPLLLTNASAPSPVSGGQLKPRQLYRLSPLGFIGVLSAGLANSAFFSMGPIFAQEIGLSLAQTSTFMALGTFSGLLLQWPLGRLSDRIDRRWVMIAVTLISALFCWLIIHAATEASLLLFAAVMIYGSTSFTLYSLSASHVNDYAPKNQLVQISGGLQIAYGVGASGGPIIASSLMTYIGPSGLFIHISLIMTTLGLFALYRMTRRAAVRRADKVTFVAQPSAQHNARALYTAAVDKSAVTAEAPAQEQKDEKTPPVS